MTLTLTQPEADHLRWLLTSHHSPTPFITALIKQIKP